jgi:hypothetical protein
MIWGIFSLQITGRGITIGQITGMGMEYGRKEIKVRKGKKVRVLYKVKEKEERRGREWRLDAKETGKP